MSDLERARAAYIDAVKNTDRRKHSFTVRARQSRAARAKAIAFPTKKNRAAYRKAKATRALRLRAYRRAREQRNKLKARYLRLKAEANLSPKEKAEKWALRQVGTTEQTGNNDGPKILKWQRHTARGATYLDRAPYCGIGCENAAAEGGFETSSRWAAVGYIEDDAKAGRNGFDRWTTNPSSIKKGEAFLVVLFGYGVHVEWGRRVNRVLRIVRTVGFNTSPGTSGSQNNGGGVWKRNRPFSQVRGYAILKNPK